MEQGQEQEADRVLEVPEAHWRDLSDFGQTGFWDYNRFEFQHVHEDGEAIWAIIFRPKTAPRPKYGFLGVYDPSVMVACPQCNCLMNKGDRIRIASLKSVQ